MSVQASQASRSFDAANDLLLRDFDQGSEADTVTETPKPIPESIRSGVIETVIHVRVLNLDGVEYFLDVLTGADVWIGDDQHILARVALTKTGQTLVSFDGSKIPDHHKAITTRLIALGEGDAECDWSAWLLSVRP